MKNKKITQQNKPTQSKRLSSQQPLRRPKSSSLSDHETPLESKKLLGKRIALVITGSIAAYRAPDLARSLRKWGAQVTPFCSKEALNYVAEEALSWASDQKVITEFSERAEHLSYDNPFDLYLVAPATYNTINKLSQGIADGLVTSLLAVGLTRVENNGLKMVLVPSMHGDMHNSVLDRSLKHLLGQGVSIMEPRDAYGKHNLPEVNEIREFVFRQFSAQS